MGNSGFPFVAESGSSLHIGAHVALPSVGVARPRNTRRHRHHCARWGENSRLPFSPPPCTLHAAMPDDFPYDVFLSHSAKDKAVVRPLAERLRVDGVKVWFANHNALEVRSR